MTKDRLKIYENKVLLMKMFFYIQHILLIQLCKEGAQLTFDLRHVLVSAMSYVRQRRGFYTSIVCTTCPLHSKCYGEEITTLPQYILKISAISPLSQVRWRSNYVPPQYILHISPPQILCRKYEGGVITYLHSIYSIFLKYLLCRRCEGGAIMHLHSIYSIYPRCSSFVVGATVKWSIYRSSI